MRLYGLCLFMVVFLAGCSSNNGVDTTGLTTSASAPTIVWTDPLPNAVGPNIMSSDNAVRIQFSAVMDTRSVTHGVAILPAGQSVYIDSNKATPVDGYTFTFPLTPTPGWSAYFSDPVINSRFPPGRQLLYTYYKVAQAYTVTIDSAIHDIYGDYLGQTLAFKFTPEPYFRVTDTYPLNNDTAVSRSNLYITIRFNSLIDSTSARSSLTISPSVSGANIYCGSWGLSWSLPSGSTLAADTKYTVTISASIKDVNGNVPPSPYSFSFTTAQ